MLRDLVARVLLASTDLPGLVNAGADAHGPGGLYVRADDLVLPLAMALVFVEIGKDVLGAAVYVDRVADHGPKDAQVSASLPRSYACGSPRHAASS